MTPDLQSLSLLTFDPASRADLLLLRATIDRALLHPGRVVDCRGAFGGAVVRLSMREGEEAGPASSAGEAEVKRLRDLCRAIEDAAASSGYSRGLDAKAAEDLRYLMSTIDGAP